ncbi:MAG: hypothetical protein SFY67_13090 [Candidatus Melainabacteria bacterium]|nr:hypothetical protein [Candidatus Melainabacteria bacterium]
MSDKKRFEYLIAKGHDQNEVIVELVGLCIYGSISDSEIRTRKCCYVYEISDQSVILKLHEDEPDIEDDIDLLDLIKVFLALSVIGAEVQVEGMWRGRFPDQEFLQKHKNHSLDFDVPLALEDLPEIRQWLWGQTRSIEELLQDPAFRLVFPSVQSRFGAYGFMRHRSGTEIRTTWTDNVYVAGHGFESAYPLQEMLEAWIKLKKLDYDPDEGFTSYRANKWKLARLLGRVPKEHKQKVYEWVNDTQFSIEEFHDSHGRTYTPESFECYFANSVITADRNYNFDLIEC